MNTLVDMLFAAPFIALLAPNARWVFGMSACAAFLVAEFFSPFSFGLLSLALCGGWFCARKLIMLFDTASLMSTGIVFFVGVGVEAFLVFLLFTVERGSIDGAAALRGGIFATRQFLAGLFVFALIMGLRAAYAVGMYAMAEEKNPFA